MKSKTFQKTFIILGTIITLSIFAGLLYLNNEIKIQGQVIQTPQTTPTPEKNLPLIKNRPIKEFQITATQFQLIPATITVKQYDFVRLIIESINVSQGITITGYNINRRLEPRETGIIEFMTDKKGEFEITCTTPCDPKYENMKGKLVVN